MVSPRTTATLHGPPREEFLHNLIASKEKILSSPKHWMYMLMYTGICICVYLTSSMSVKYNTYINFRKHSVVETPCNYQPPFPITRLGEEYMTTGSTLMQANLVSRSFIMCNVPLYKL